VASAHEPFSEHDYRSQDKQYEAQRKGHGPVGQLVVLDRTGKRVVAQDRNRAEVGDRIEEHEQHSRCYRAGRLRKDDPSKDAPRAIAEESS